MHPALKLLAVVLLLACAAPEPPAGETRGESSVHTTGSWSDALRQQEQRVAELRDSVGTSDPRTLVALAQLLRLRAAQGDPQDTAPLVDEILDLDLRRSPALGSSKPSIVVARDLASLGELSAAGVLIKDALEHVKRREDNEFALEVRRALARLKVAEEDPEGPAELAEVEAKQADIFGPRLEAARTMWRDRRLYSEFGKMPIGARAPAVMSSTSIGVTEEDHAHFDRILDLGPKPALEVAERLRGSLGIDLSLLTRLWKRGVPEDTAKGSRRLHFGQEPQLEPLPASDPELEKLESLLQALTRALDRLSATDARFEELRAERGRLHYLRTQRLNEIWSASEVVGIPTTEPEFQPSLDPGTVMLYYMVASDHTDLLVLARTGGTSGHRIDMGSQALSRELDRLVSEARAQPTRGATLLADEATPGHDTSEEAARRLYDLLVAPAEAEIAAADRLLIIPDGPLHRLPFAALKRQDAEGNEHYLADWKPLHLAPSAATYMALVGRRPTENGSPGGLIAFGNPAYSQPAVAGQQRALPYAVRAAGSRGFSGLLPPLPGSKREVEQIGKLFADSGRSASVLLGPEAREASVKAAAQDATYLHFATHGFVDSGQPEHSFLALSLPPAILEGEDNGILEGWEIVDGVSLNAELVVLSACETALGIERSGEGPTSLSTAFLAAGSRSVLASIWKVDDDATAELMTSFYRHLLDGSPKDEALRLAQLELLHGPNPRFQSPYYWAAFQLTGDRR